MKMLLPMARYIGMGVRGMFEKPGKEGKKPGKYHFIHQRINSRLDSAGRPEGINADEYVGFIVINALLGGIVGVLLFLFAEMFSLYLMFFFGLALGAMRMPSWLKRRMQARHTKILKELPFALDLFTLATEAGLDFTSALGRIVGKLGQSPLGEELQLMLREIRLGKPRSDAMRDMSRRVGVAEVRSVMTGLVQAEEMGSNIGPILRIQAEQQRERRSQRAEETAAKMPVKLVFPLVLIMLVTFLFIFGPMAIQMFAK